MMHHFIGKKLSYLPEKNVTLHRSVEQPVGWMSNIIVMAQ